MQVEFLDLRTRPDPEQKIFLQDKKSLEKFLQTLQQRDAFIFDLIGDNGFKLGIGLDKNIGCVQFSPANGMPPYLMAIGNPNAPENIDHEFVMGGTATPVQGRYLLPFESVKDIACYFVETGDRSPAVNWDEI